MIISIGEKKLLKLIKKQLKNNFNINKNEASNIDQITPYSLIRTEKCFSENINKYYWNDKKKSVFNPYHSGQYSIFLYFLSQQALKIKNKQLADKIYYLNKMLNCCDIYYETNLPDIFFLDHPVGSVMGRASYSNYFTFAQNCTVGGNHGIYPCFGEFVSLFANATVIGNSQIGNNVFISANTLVKDEVISDNTIVFGKSPNLIFKQKPPEYFYQASVFKSHKKLLK